MPFSFVLQKFGNGVNVSTVEREPIHTKIISLANMDLKNKTYSGATKPNLKRLKSAKAS